MPVSRTGAYGRSRLDTPSLRCPWGAHRELCVWVWAEVMCRPLGEQTGVDLLRTREIGPGPGARVLVTWVNPRLPLTCLPPHSRCPFTQEAPCWVTSYMVTHQDFRAGRWEASGGDQPREDGEGCPHGPPAAPVPALGCPSLSQPRSCLVYGCESQGTDGREKWLRARGSDPDSAWRTMDLGPGFLHRVLRTSKGILCGGDCPVLCKMFSNSSDFYPPAAAPG